MSRTGVLSLLASLTGAVALLGDVLSLVILVVPRAAPQSHVEAVFTIVNLAGLLLGVCCGLSEGRLKRAPRKGGPIASSETRSRLMR